MPNPFSFKQIPVRRCCFIVCALVVAAWRSSILFAENINSSQFNMKEYLEQLNSMPEEKMDIGLVALNLCREFYPNLDVEKYSHKIDSLVNQIQQEVRGSTDSLVRIAAINKILFQQEHYIYDEEILKTGKVGIHDLSCLNYLLNTKRGNCNSLTVLYLAVAKRLGYPVYPVIAPIHCFPRYVDRATQQYYNIETTGEGMFRPDEFYIEILSISLKGKEAGSYLKTLSFREFVGYLLQVNWTFLVRNDRSENNLFYLKTSEKLNPRNPEIYMLFSECYAALSAIASKENSKVYYEKFLEYQKAAYNLGYVAMEDTAYYKIRNGQ